MATHLPVTTHLERDVFSRKCLSVAATTFLLYDTLCTVPEELQFFWRPPKTAVTYLFFIYRYSAIADTFTITIADFSQFPEGGCKIYNVIHQVLLVVLQVIVSALLALRIVALYRGHRSVLTLLALVIVACIAATLWGLLAQQPHSAPVSNCFATSGVEPVASWIALFVFDCLIFSLTVAKTWDTSQRTVQTPAIISVLLHDGALYFVVMAAANLINIFTFFFLTGIMRGLFSTPSNSIAVVLMSRLLFNLRRTMHNRAAQGLGRPGTTSGSSSSARAPLTTLISFHTTSLIEELALHGEGDTSHSGTSRGARSGSRSRSSRSVEIEVGSEPPEEMELTTHLP